MHELSLCEGVLQLLEDSAGKEGFRRVKKVRLEVGALSGVETESLRLNFTVAAGGTLADGASLEIIEVPGAAWCGDCGCTVPVAQRFDACPLCGNQHMRVTAGTEMRIRELEVE